MRACAVRSPADWDDFGEPLRRLGPDDWRWFVQVAHVHGFAGLLARNLGWAERRLSVPIPAVAELATLRRQQLPVLLALQAAAREAGGAFAANNIPFILLKGAALAGDLYGDLSLRAFGDTDVLVAPEHVERAAEVLLGLGYRNPLGSVAAYRRRGSHAAEFRRPKSSVDLHWELSGGEFRPENHQLIWANSRAVPEGGLPGLRLNPAMSFVYLATHFYWHGFRTFKPMLDAYLAACRAEHEQQAVIDIARATDRMKLIQLTARLCERHFPSTPLLAKLAAMPAGPRMRIAERLLGCDHFLAPAGGYAASSDRILRLAVAGNRRTVAEALRQILWPRPSELAERFDRPYAPALYPAYFARQAKRVLTGSNKAFDELS